VTAVMMLALGLGASVAIFAFVDAGLLKPLPYAEPSRVMGVYETHPLCPKCIFRISTIFDWKRWERSLVVEAWGGTLLVRCRRARSGRLGSG